MTYLNHYMLKALPPLQSDLQRLLTTRQLVLLQMMPARPKVELFLSRRPILFRLPVLVTFLVVQPKLKLRILLPPSQNLLLSLQLQIWMIVCRMQERNWCPVLLAKCFYASARSMLIWIRVSPNLFLPQVSHTSVESNLFMM